MGHFSFDVFLLDFGVCSEPPWQSWVESIAVDLASLTFLTKSAFFSFLQYVTFISLSTSRSSASVMSSALPSFRSSHSFFLSISSLTALSLSISFSVGTCLTTWDKSTCIGHFPSSTAPTTCSIDLTLHHLKLSVVDNSHSSSFFFWKFKVPIT